MPARFHHPSTKLIIIRELHLPFMDINYPGVAYVDTQLSANCPGTLTYSSKRGYASPPTYLVVVCVVVLSLFIYPNLLFLVVLACQSYCLEQILLEPVNQTAFLMTTCLQLIVFCWLSMCYYCLFYIKKYHLHLTALLFCYFFILFFVAIKFFFKIFLSKKITGAIMNKFGKNILPNDDFNKNICLHSQSLPGNLNKK